MNPGDLVFNPMRCFLYHDAFGDASRALSEITNSKFLDVRITALVITVLGLSDVLLLTDFGMLWGYRQNWVVT